MSLTEKEFDTLFRVADVKLAMNPHWRNGQSLFNALCDLHPDIANEIRGDLKLDPFYNEENIGNLLRHLKDDTVNLFGDVNIINRQNNNGAV